ncbi:hypothetical protein M113_3696 [Bacteroides fragilis str. 3986 N3]|nr:hypothetical protein M111_3368 [Bacteroides fragilis str. 3986T(B)10]EYA51382.1 hypothetical protein M114_3711 [Bacteroides fragilis str. 3986 N(B)22]EYA55888.1 hypothetical protein M112_3724 [Bacteroides fragilis str. 3986 T(B)13]EYE66589.1 hypothetical protein M113_3696 [Bacteroides fragilis str. 3986 N3]
MPDKLHVFYAVSVSFVIVRNELRFLFPSLFFPDCFGWL